MLPIVVCPLNAQKSGDGILHVIVYGLYVKSAQIKNQELKKLKCRFEDLSPQTFQSSLCRFALFEEKKLARTIRCSI